MAKFVQMIVTSMVGCAFDHGRRDAPYGKSVRNDGCSLLVNRMWRAVSQREGKDRLVAQRDRAEHGIAKVVCA
jgi:hypothetical protein